MKKLIQYLQEIASTDPIILYARMLIDQGRSTEAVTFLRSQDDETLIETLGEQGVLQVFSVKTKVTS